MSYDSRTIPKRGILTVKSFSAPWELKAPRILGVRLEGHLSGWAAPKDVIMKLAGLLTVRGGTGFVIEYFGPGVDTISCSGMATVCNMGAEVGATTSIFPFTQSMKPYLRSTHRAPLLQKASSYAGHGGKSIQLLRADPEAIYDEVITIDLSNLEPHINGPFTPDLSTPLSQFKDAVKINEWPESFGAGLIGSCTNSSYQDMTRYVHFGASPFYLAANWGFVSSFGSRKLPYLSERSCRLGETP